MKYRLKQWYPSLPNEWKDRKVIVKKRDNYIYVGLMENGFNNLSPKEVENNPEYWEPVEEPLFTTEDGVDIYEGDWYYYVTEKYHIGERQCPYYSHDDNFIATFSTRQKAQHYVNKHKPKYSLSDIEKAFKKIGL